MVVIRLYWFAAQQEASTSTRQKYGSAYLKFSVEVSERTPVFVFTCIVVSFNLKMISIKIFLTSSHSFINP